MTTHIQSTRDGFGLGLLQVAETNQDIVALCADLTESMRLHWFRDQYPERFIEVGVAEQNLIGIAAGLALGGLKPFAASYACFSPANSWGVIRTSVCYNDVPVVIVGGHAGIVTGEDGATHQSLEDIATMRALPNMTIVIPADGEEARKATVALANYPKPAYLRVSKNTLESITSPTDEFSIGKGTVLQEGTSVALIACGAMVGESLKAAELLKKQKITCTVVNMHTIKPIDADLVDQLALTHKLLVTIEDHQIIGGLGSAVCEVVAESATQSRVLRLGMSDRFGESGKPEQLLKRFGLDAVGIAKAIQKTV